MRFLIFLHCVELLNQFAGVFGGNAPVLHHLQDALAGLPAPEVCVPRKAGTRERRAGVCRPFRSTFAFTPSLRSSANLFFAPSLIPVPRVFCGGASRFFDSGARKTHEHRHEICRNFNRIGRAVRPLHLNFHCRGFFGLGASFPASGSFGFCDRRLVRQRRQQLRRLAADGSRPPPPCLKSGLFQFRSFGGFLGREERSQKSEVRRKPTQSAKFRAS